MPKTNFSTELDNIHKLINEIKSDLKGKATTSKIDELVKEIREKDRKIEILEAKVAVLGNAINLLSVKCEENEQYSRRVSLRINQLPLPDEESDETETSEDVLDKVKELIEEAEIEIPDDCIDRAHRVGKAFVDTNGARKQQVIVRFTTWRHRTLF